MPASSMETGKGTEIISLRNVKHRDTDRGGYSAKKWCRDGRTTTKQDLLCSCTSNEHGDGPFLWQLTAVNYRLTWSPVFHCLPSVSCVSCQNKLVLLTGLLILSRFFPSCKQIACLRYVTYQRNELITPIFSRR